MTNVMLVHDADNAEKPIVFSRAVKGSEEVYDAIEAFFKRKEISVDADMIGELGDEVLKKDFSWCGEKWLFSVKQLEF